MAKRVYERWRDHHRENDLGRMLRELASQAARFDSTPSDQELEALCLRLSWVFTSAGNHLEHTQALCEHMYQIGESIDQAKAGQDSGRSEWQLFGLGEDESLHDRLSALYKMRPPVWK